HVSDSYQATTATVYLTVHGTNTAPSAGNDSYSAVHDQVLSVSSRPDGVLTGDADAEGDTLAAVLVSGPSHGNVTLYDDGTFYFTPAVGYIGSDSFTYKANDGVADSNTATVSLTVTNQTPAPVNDSYVVNENTVLTAPAAAGVMINDIDPDGDPL